MAMIPEELKDSIEMDKIRLERIYERTSGKCHLCHKKLAFSNYGKINSKGSWEIEHSKPRSKGGSDHLNNLYPACITCNRSKGNNSNASVRGRNGVKNTPLSVNQRKKIVRKNTIGSVVAGSLIGARVLGPVGFILGGAIGALVGSEIEVKDV